MKDGAPGPDGRKLRDLKGMPLTELQCHFNLWLLAGYQPAALRQGVTVFIPKVEGTCDPAQHRPIRQKAFRAGDSTAESVWFLQQLIQKHKDQLSPLNIALVNVKKAFNSVSHQSIILAAKRLGAPPPLLSYLTELYSDTWTTICAGGERGEAIRGGRGVRQGDPMSPHLFNAVIDWVIQDLDLNIGALIGDGRMNVCAFADDLVLIVATPLRLAVTQGDMFPRKRGADSSHVDHPSPKIPGRRDLRGGDQSKGSENKLQRGLSHLSAAPLKPQQRLYILKHHLLPALYH